MSRARSVLLAAICSAVASATALADESRTTANGLVTVPSVFGTKETVQRLEAAIKARGMSVFAHIDHAAAAAAAGLALRPTELLIFGGAKTGTPLMQANQAIGIDLPLKALVYQDADGKVWLAYNDPHWLAKRHGFGAESAATLDGMSAALAAVVRKATTSSQ